MEYDNDKPVKRAYAIEIFYWILLAIMYPLVYSLTYFLNNIRIWPVLFLINFLILPVYLFYAMFIVNKFLFAKRQTLFFVLSFLFLVIIQLIISGIYAIVTQFNLNAAEHDYFIYNFKTAIREILWCVLYMSLSVGIFYIKKAIDEKELVTNLEKENIRFKLKYFRSQLNPHFLFNTLNSIYSLSLQKSDKAPDVVIMLSDLMRYMIYECNEEKVPLSKEIEFIKNYIEIEKIRHKADVHLNIEGDAYGIMIEPFLFISFVENGFKHAFDSAYNKAFVYITLKIEAEQILLTVINSTNLDLESQAKKAEGTGIRNSKSLLELLYQNSYKLDIIQTDKEEARGSELRMRNAKKRLEVLYPDSHTLDVILKNNAFTVSLMIKPSAA